MAFYFPGTRGLEDIARREHGVVSWSYNPTFTSTGSALTSQTIYAVAVPYRAGQVVTNIGWLLNTAAAGTTPTGMYVGLSSATTVLADSANLAGAAGWTSTGFKAFALSAAYTVPADDVYFHLLLLNGTFSVTNPVFARNTALVAVQIGSGDRLNATGGTGQTTLPAVSAAITLASTGTPHSFFTYST